MGLLGGPVTFGGLADINPVMGRLVIAHRTGDNPHIGGPAACHGAGDADNFLCRRTGGRDRPIGDCHLGDMRHVGHVLVDGTHRHPQSRNSARVYALSNVARKLGQALAPQIIALSLALTGGGDATIKGGAVLPGMILAALICAITIILYRPTTNGRNVVQPVLQP